MYGKLFLKHTLLGLIFFSFVPSAHSGRFEQAFLDEVKKGCPRLVCERFENNGGHKYRREYTSKELVGETRVPYYSGHYTTQHYKITTKYEDAFTPDNWQCVDCGANKVGWKGRIYVNVFISKDRIEIKLLSLNGYFKPCELKSSDPSDLLGVIYRQYYHDNSKYQNYRDKWSKALNDLWIIAVKLDLEDAKKEKNNEEEKPLMVKSEKIREVRAIEEESCCYTCLVQ